MKKAVFACLVLAYIFPVSCADKKPGPVSYEFTSVRRGNIERTVTSSGTINPVSTAKVLPQMSGKVEKIFVDYNDTVRKGDILAELNTDMLKLKRDQQYASVTKARANYELQEINYRNQATLAEKNLISDYELKTTKTSLDGQAADLAIAEANLNVIETEINQYAYITSPINGIVLDRKINIGDTVADSSSANSSSIFTLAENLSEMQIEAAVGELDVVSIHKGQTVRFTLESLPGRSFTGEVETLRLVPVISNNVVSYTVIIKVENQDGSLFPGMTCAVDFIVESSEDTLMVSNAALRYRPTNVSEEQIAEMLFNAELAGMSDKDREAAERDRAIERAKDTPPREGGGTGAGIGGIMMGGGRRMPRGGRGGNQQGAGQTGSPEPALVTRNLWFINSEGKLDVMRVQAGISSGSMTAIITNADIEGRQVILREKI